MSKPTITFACGLYDRMVALYTGEVKPVGFDLNFIAINDPRQIFDRMAGRQEFDASEMSSSEFIARTSAGQNPFVALPVFASRVFRHSTITVNRKSGIRTPKDLEGKRVGTPLYTQTAAIFIRGLLQHEYGVDLSTIHWVQGAMNTAGSHGNPSALPLLKNADIQINKSGKSLSELLDAGEIDAIAATTLPPAMRHNPDIQRLFPNYREVEKEYFKKTKIFPIMHLIALRRDVHEKYPFVATSLYNALCESRKAALELMRYTGALRYMLPWLAADLDEIDEVFGGDPWPYGVEANRPTLEAMVTYMAEQSMIAKAMPIEDLFVQV
jgi:4,5-dihydroxyphthalate decarboxylase